MSRSFGLGFVVRPFTRQSRQMVAPSCETMITKVAAGVAGSSLVLLFFYGGIFRNILLPGFYVSSQITLSSDGAGYLAVGLAIDAVLLSYCVYWLLWAPKSIPDLRRQFRPSRLVSLAVLALVIFYLKPLTTFGYVKWQARKSPEMWVMPMPLPEVPPEACVGVRHSYFGYEFKVPWPQVN